MTFTALTNPTSILMSLPHISEAVPMLPSVRQTGLLSLRAAAGNDLQMGCPAERAEEHYNE